MTAPFRIWIVAALVGVGSPLRSEPLAQVIACDTLVNLRVLMSTGERSVAETALPRHPGCRLVPRGRIGAAEHRAMVGGAPYECLSVTGESACAWIWP